MKTAYFLIPDFFTSDKKIPLEFTLLPGKIDKRTRFWRFNRTRQISYLSAVTTAEKCGMQIFRNDHGIVCRILAPNGEAAVRFYRAIHATGWEA